MCVYLIMETRISEIFSVKSFYFYYLSQILISDNFERRKYINTIDE